MRELKSPPRNAAHAGGVARNSMVTVLSIALAIGLTPAQAMAVTQEDTPALEQASPAEGSGEKDGGTTETSADASESPETAEGTEVSTDDGAEGSGASAAEEPAFAADAEGQGTGGQSSSEGVAPVLGSSSTNIDVSNGETVDLGALSWTEGTVTLKITKGGTYTFKGSRPNTQIKVDTNKDEQVVLYLDGVEIDNCGHDLSAISIEDDSQVTIRGGATSTLKGGAKSASSGDGGAGIYVNHDAAVTFASGANIVAYGAVVDGTTQGQRAAGIGGAGSGHSDSGQIMVEGGSTIEAHGAASGNGGAGIGSGYDGVCNGVVIKGGTVTAWGGPGAAGIGSAAANGAGNGGNVSSAIRILYGTVTATGGSKDGFYGGAGIGSGTSGDQNGGIEIRYATVTATGGDGGAGIGSGCGGDSKGAITIDDSTVDATGGYEAAGIGSGYDGVSKDISISGDNTTVNADGGAHAAGIGSGESFSLYHESLDLGSGGNQEGTITISGGNVNARGVSGGIPIGAGQGGVLNGDITISGGNVYTIRNNDVSAIGAAAEGKFNSTITISGGTVSSSTYTTYVFGSSYLGKWADRGTVKITGGTVKVKCSNNQWSSPKKDQIVITGGSVLAVSTSATDGQGNAVYRTTLPLPDATTPITDIASNTSYASAKDIFPDDDGNIYLYLPLTAADGNENEVYINQEGKASHYRDNHTTNTYATGILKMDGKISFKQTDGTMTVGDVINVEMDDSDSSLNDATWRCTSEGDVEAYAAYDPSLGPYLEIEAKGAGPYSVTVTLRESSKYYWTATGTFTGTVLEPASITLGSLTKRYDGRGISLGGLARTDSDGRLSYAFERLKDGTWQKVDISEVVGEGRYRVTATTEQTDTHAAGTASQEFDILPAVDSTNSTTDTNAAATTGAASKSPAASTKSVTTQTTQKSQTSQKSSLPNTGDGMQPMVPLALGALGTAVMAGALALRSRKNRS